MQPWAVATLQYIRSYSHALLEALAIAVTSILPIILVSAFLVGQNNVQPDWNSINAEVWRSLSEGDVGYLILSLCGSIFFLYLTALRKQPGAILIIFFMATLGMVIFSSMIIAIPPSEMPLVQNPFSGWAGGAYLFSMCIFVYCRAAATRDVGADFHRVADSGVSAYLRKPEDGQP